MKKFEALILSFKWEPKKRVKKNRKKKVKAKKKTLVLFSLALK